MTSLLSCSMCSYSLFPQRRDLVTKRKKKTVTQDIEVKNIKHELTMSLDILSFKNIITSNRHKHIQLKDLYASICQVS